MHAAGHVSSVSATVRPMRFSSYVYSNGMGPSCSGLLVVAFTHAATLAPLACNQVADTRSGVEVLKR